MRKLLLIATLVIIGLALLTSCFKSKPKFFANGTVVMPTQRDSHRTPFVITGIYYQDEKNYYYSLKDADSLVHNNYPDYALRLARFDEQGK